MNLVLLVARGFSKEEVYNMTIKQVYLISEVATRMWKFERLAKITDLQCATPGVDEIHFSKHINSLRYE